MHWHLCNNVCFFSFLTHKPLLINNSRHTAPGHVDVLPIHSVLPRFFAIILLLTTTSEPLQLQRPQTALIGCLVGSLKGREGKDYCLYQTTHLQLFVQHREWYQTEFKQVYFVRLQCTADLFLCSCVATDSQERWLMAFLCKRMMRILQTKCFGGKSTEELSVNVLQVWLDYTQGIKICGRIKLFYMLV